MKNCLFIIIALLLIFCSAGCVQEVADSQAVPLKQTRRLDPEPEVAAYQPPVLQQASPATDPRTQISNRFVGSHDQTESAVEKALMWSDKYQQLSQKTEELRSSNTQLTIQNNELRLKTNSLQSQLNQTTKELNDANAFLQELQLELTRWKSDVLGYRQEMRAAQAAQIQALSKILRVLGAEAIEEPVDMTEPVDSEAKDE